MLEHQLSATEESEEELMRLITPEYSEAQVQTMPELQKAVEPLGLVGQRQLKHVMHAMRDTGTCLILHYLDSELKHVDTL